LATNVEIPTLAASFLIAVRRMERGIPTEVTEQVEASPSLDT
jgi:hypothetical protein